LSHIRLTEKDFLGNKAIAAFAVNVARNLQDWDYNGLTHGDVATFVPIGVCPQRHGQQRD